MNLYYERIFLINVIVWSASFILTKNVVANVSVLNLITYRFVIAFIIVSIFSIGKFRHIDREVIKSSAKLGTILYLAYLFQTIGLKYTTATKAAFINSLIVIFVPLILFFTKGKKLNKITLFICFVNIIGIGLLTLNYNLGINLGDFLMLIAAVFFALHIIVVGAVSSLGKNLLIGTLQFGFLSFISIIFSIAFEPLEIYSNSSFWIPMIVLSIFCTAIPYIVQIYIQKVVNEERISLLFTAEPVFAAIIAYFVAGEILTPKEFVGALVIFLSLNIETIYKKFKLHEVD